MPGDIRQRLDHDAVDRRLYVRRQALVIHPHGLDIDSEPVERGTVPRVPYDRHFEPEVIQHPGMQSQCESSQVHQGPVDDAAHATGVSVNRGGGFGFPDETEADLQGGQRLTGFIVKLARDATPFVLLCPDELRA